LPSGSGRVGVSQRQLHRVTDNTTRSTGKLPVFARFGAGALLTMEHYSGLAPIANHTKGAHHLINTARPRT
jgi:hypothetical protein